MKTNLLTCLFILFSLVLFSQEKSESKELPKGEIFASKQAVTINGKPINLDAETGTVQLRDENDKPIALFGFTHYKKTGANDNRPIVFAFNGGPLSASFWLHFGVLGPKRVEINDPYYTKAAPYKVVNNEFSILDKADLVMIDPIGVGFSKPIGDSKWEDFWGVEQDIRSIGLFIEQFLIRSEKFNAPKYLLGESYGTFRNAGLVKHLQDKGISMNGVIMVSAVFELQHLLFGPGDDVAYLIHFPAYAATAWYHNKVKNKGDNLESFIMDVRKFTENEYAHALLKGDQLTASENNAVAQKLEDYSGVSKDYWLKANLRVTNGEYFQELLRQEGLTVGRLDSRFTGINEDLISQNASTDPQSDAISSPYISAYKDYLYNDLKVRKDLSYATSTGSRKDFKWDWNHSGNVIWNAQVAVSTLPDMTSAMKRNPNLKILILNGYYDLATVFYGVEYSINHMGLDAELKKNIIMKYYEAGHMMYTHKPSMVKFKKDVDEFIDQTSN
jgi:carboxypeptidase C (cathepsin A)|tara:strand:- start:2829 stop:4331 length:1503 start_codon:yes stop_codon:yes gene_type:complete